MPYKIVWKYFKDFFFSFRTYFQLLKIFLPFDTFRRMFWKIKSGKAGMMTFTIFGNLKRKNENLFFALFYLYFFSSNKAKFWITFLEKRMFANVIWYCIGFFSSPLRKWQKVKFDFLSFFAAFFNEKIIERFNSPFQKMIFPSFRCLKECEKCTLRDFFFALSQIDYYPKSYLLNGPTNGTYVRPKAICKMEHWRPKIVSYLGTLWWEQKKMQ